jgi:transposase-like protein
MLLHGQGRSSLEMSNGRPLCPKCRVPMWTVYTENGESDGQRSFVCPRCEHSHGAHRWMAFKTGTRTTKSPENA